MEEERVGMVLVRASELRSKIANCIPKTHHIQGSSVGNGVDQHSSSMEDGDQVAADDEEAEALFSICHAFDSLESRLSSFQALLQQQEYQRETVIGEIDYSRKLLLQKLAEHKGQHSDVIHEAEAFASMKVDHDNELLLPPYPSHTPPSLILDNGEFSHFSYSHKQAENGCNDIGLNDEPKNSQAQSRPGKIWGGLRFLVQSTAKTMLTLVGVISVLSLAGFEPRLSRKGAHFKVLTQFQQSGEEDRRLTKTCPPGKVVVMEDGEIRCIVKERVEIPFDSVSENLGVNYGCG